MEADDLEAGRTRLDVVKEVVADFAERRMTDEEGASDNVALFSFARFPQQLCPFTLDVDAVKGYTKVLEEYPESDVVRDTRYGRALAYHYSGSYNRALVDYKWLLDTKVSKAMQLKVSFSMALSYSAQGSDAEAEKLLRKSIANYPYDDEAKQLLKELEK